MKKLLTIALLLAVAASASALDRSPRKKKRDKKAKTETADGLTAAPIPAGQEVLIVIGEGLDKERIEAVLRN